ncbi:MAG: DUF116 domain-containing protein [Calditrichaceae bacterium]|nr:DUF116 domain-containing protein [Calditrichaceae bacterium]RQV93381.1 MAG: DUF116 domain-containing protein [Calditrichota bacterium]
METITYNLKPDGKSSDEYYETIHLFSKQVYEQLEKMASALISDYQEFIQYNDIEKLRSRGEYAVELLILGMAWQRYLGAAKHTNVVLLKLMDVLFQWRNKYFWIKPEIDMVRGWISGHFMTPKISKFHRSRRFTLHNFKRLILWLRASGEFMDEVRRLSQWRRFCQMMGRQVTHQTLEKANEMIDWFREEAQMELGAYTDGVTRFLKEEHHRYRYREDEIFTGKEPLEYHLNMVGAEIMNRGFEEDYNKTRRCVVLLPKCMTSPGDGKCRAKAIGFDIACQRCTPTCNIARISRLGDENGFEVRIVPHTSGFITWLKRWQNDPDVGLIAVACLLNLVTGGYEMRQLDLNAQCLLLDYCGCKKHWHPDGLPTDINTDELLRMIKQKTEVLSENRMVV